MAAAVRAQGLRVITGEEMLLHQGALAFTRWTGVEPSLDAMRAALEGAVRAADEEESSSCPSK
jgi:shikimate 5-dehydrogenase